VSAVFVDVGCGERKHAGSLGLDIAAVKGVDVVADARSGLPFRDCTVDGIYATHVLEHFDDLVGIMAEIWRVCRDGARVYITVPHASSSFMAWRDPTHKRGVLLSTFTYFDRTTSEGALFDYYGDVNFRTVYTRLRFAAGGREGRLAPGRRFISALITDMLEAVANRSRYAQHLCERWWGNFIGVAEAYAVLEVVK